MTIEQQLGEQLSSLGVSASQVARELRHFRVHPCMGCPHFTATVEVQSPAQNGAIVFGLGSGNTAARLRKCCTLLPNVHHDPMRGLQVSFRETSARCPFYGVADFADLAKRVASLETRVGQLEAKPAEEPNEDEE